MYETVVLGRFDVAIFLWAQLNRWVRTSCRLLHCDQLRGQPSRLCSMSFSDWARATAAIVITMQLVNACNECATSADRLTDFAHTGG